MIAKDWSIKTGVRADVILRRLSKGISPELAIFYNGSFHNTNTSPMIEAAAEKKRQQTHCKRGHPLSGDNLHTYHAKNGWTARVCRTCKRQAVARYRKEK